MSNESSTINVEVVLRSLCVQPVSDKQKQKSAEAWKYRSKQATLFRFVASIDGGIQRHKKKIIYQYIYILQLPYTSILHSAEID